VIIGPPSDEQKNLAEKIHKAHLKSIEAMRPGIKACELREIVGKNFDDVGVDWTFKIGRSGHGIGLEMAEQPSIDPYNQVVLETGMTIAMEPAILADCGLFNMEEDILITEEGSEVLGPTWPRDGSICHGMT